MLFGGEGPTEIVRIDKALNRSDLGIQLIPLCGNNAAVAQELRALDRRIPMLVEGLTREIPEILQIVLEEAGDSAGAVVPTCATSGSMRPVQAGATD